MNPILIDWLGMCPRCNCTAALVTTDRGNYENLYEGDKLECAECGSKGEVTIIDDYAIADWEYDRGLNVLSLFDGISAGQIALERAGVPVENYYASEVDKHAINVTNENWPNTIQLGDVTDWKTWDIDWKSIDLLIGGSPCQGFSFAGKQLAFNDPRSKLFFEYVNILNHIKEANPRVKFLLENVKMKKEFTDVIDRYLGVEAININSSLLSAQNRVRLYWTNIEGVVQPSDKGIKLVDILEPEVDKKYFHTSKGVEYMNRSVKGGRTHWDFAHHSDSIKDKASCLTANIHKGVPYNVLVCGRVVGRRINPVTGCRDDYNKDIPIIQRFEPRVDGRCGCLTTVQKDNTLGTEDGIIVRKFTPLECERLQTIPENYTSSVSDTQRYRALGNGWTVDVIAHIFKNL